ncbi:hypothetical protein KGA66_22050 [Actinocrinis puniceicyclus]|uniref:Uncharacterized protein n=1 Tax=Actinocrinis puniceicyclus TaxID=977794 RepID=A0A8J8BF26_9ACTN|nr:hypothetical protein [Actinocrinis puniceicyclus]MBS2965751.1 hypothetical protein [Actinocrinis puniceicyclus]
MTFAYGSGFGALDAGRAAELTGALTAAVLFAALADAEADAETEADADLDADVGADIGADARADVRARAEGLAAADVLVIGPLTTMPPRTGVRTAARAAECASCAARALADAEPPSTTRGEELPKAPYEAAAAVPVGTTIAAVTTAVNAVGRDFGLRCAPMAVCRASPPAAYRVS